MKMLISVLLALAALASTASAQSQLARLKFEDAEAAFAERKYSATLVKLGEAELELGEVNPPILYLRILAQYALLDAPEEETDFPTVIDLKRNCEIFLERYGSIEVLLEKLREVQRISEALKAFPGSAEEASANTLFAEITSLDQVVEDEFFEDHTRARLLRNKTEEYLALIQGMRTVDSQKVAFAREVNRKLSGLDDYLSGKHLGNVQGKHAQAFLHLSKAAEQGMPSGIRAVGVSYLIGRGVEQNTELGKIWLYRAADAGSVHAMAVIGESYWKGLWGFPNDNKQARAWFEKAVSYGKGDRDALFSLGAIHFMGEETPVNYFLAKDYFSRAMEKGHAYATFYLGYMSSVGIEGPVDWVKAVEWWEKAAQLGSIDAMKSLKEVFKYGRAGVAQNFELAFDWGVSARRAEELEADKRRILAP